MQAAGETTVRTSAAIGASALAVAPGVFSFAVIAATAAEQGGYFPTAWGWSALGCLLVAFAVVVLGGRVAFTRHDRALVITLLALLAWTAASALWSASVGRSMQDVERTIVYVAALLALLMLARTGATAVAAGIAFAAAAVSWYAVSTRLLPGTFGYAVSGDYRLARPVGYWNGLAVLAAVGLVLSLGLVSGSSRRPVRVVAAASLPVLTLAVYFAFSRGGWLALVLGLAVTLSVDSHRLRLATKAAPLALFSAIAVFLASRDPALVESGQPYARAVHEGHTLALALAPLVLASALVGSLDLSPPRRAVDALPRLTPRARRVMLAALVVLVLAAIVSAIWVGGLGRTYDAFRSSRQGPTGTLASRLFSASGDSRADYWRVAWGEYASHPLLGSGAGTFELYWARNRPVPVGSRFAHNLYLQTLAELGPVGLFLLGLALFVPLAAIRSARQLELVPAAAGAYAAVVAHAALDWDWQLPAVMLAGLLAGGAILTAAREATPPQVLSRRARAALLGLVAALAAFAATGWAGNRAVVRSAGALARGDYRRAALDARAARRWQPWASEPWRQLGLAQLGEKRIGAARASFRRAVAKDRLDWQTWYDLALVSHGGERATAARHARRLNPLSPQVVTLAAGR